MVEESRAIPGSIQELRKKWGRASLRRGLVGMFGEDDLPEHILNSEGEARRAAAKLCEVYQEPLAELSRAAKQALRCYYELGKGGHEAALLSFHSTILTTYSRVSAFLDEPQAQYLCSLIASSVGDADRFKALLELFVKLGQGNGR